MSPRHLPMLFLFTFVPTLLATMPSLSSLNWSTPRQFPPGTPLSLLTLGLPVASALASKTFSPTLQALPRSRTYRGPTLLLAKVCYSGMSWIAMAESIPLTSKGTTFLRPRFVSSAPRHSTNLLAVMEYRISPNTSLSCRMRLSLMLPMDAPTFLFSLCAPPTTPHWVLVALFCLPRI